MIMNTFNYEFGQSQFLSSSNDEYGHRKIFLLINVAMKKFS